MTDRYYPTSTAFLEVLAEADVEFIFANLGSDHPGIIGALAQARAEGRDGDFPTLIVCPPGIAAAPRMRQALVSRKPAAVIVHVDAGTQNIGGAISASVAFRNDTFHVSSEPEAASPASPPHQAAPSPQR